MYICFQNIETSHNIWTCSVKKTRYLLCAQTRDEFHAHSEKKSNSSGSWEPCLSILDNAYFTVRLIISFCHLAISNRYTSSLKSIMLATHSYYDTPESLFFKCGFPTTLEADYPDKGSFFLSHDVGSKKKHPT